MILTVILAKLERMSGEDDARTVWLEVSADRMYSRAHPLPDSCELQS
jgi:hypothetical protein